MKRIVEPVPCPRPRAPSSAREAALVAALFAVAFAIDGLVRT
jgi:hypothetical protein